MERTISRPSIRSHRSHSLRHLSDIQDYVPQEPVEPTISTGVGMIARSQARIDNHEERKDIAGVDNMEPKSHYVFRFLREEKPLPSKRMMGVMLAVLFLVMFLAGWNDASQGPLLPSLQTYYSVNYLVISTIWLANFAGFMTSGITNVFISDAFGFGIAAPFGAALQGLAYILICWGSPFPLFVIAYIFNGFGLGLQDAQVNSLVTRLENSSTKMFLMHAMYGFGATVSPFVSTAFVQHIPNHVYYYFAVSLGLALVTVLALVVVFRGRTDNQVVGKRQLEVKVNKDGSTTENEPASKENEGSGGKMKQILKAPVVHYMAFYMLIYVGIEVTIGGWATSFLIDERGGNDNSGYVSSGYFGGLTVGRVVLIPVTKRIGNHMSIYLYSLITLVLTIIIWFIHSIVGNAICFSLVGVFLGPMYPIVMNVVVEILPGELQGGTIGWIASLGQAGSAIMPFMVGAISERYGVWILQPFTLAFTVADILLWFLVTRSWRKHVKSIDKHSSNPVTSDEKKDGEGRDQSSSSVNQMISDLNRNGNGENAKNQS
ncbi:hypothetical protein I203_107487 [Kwoniella mangroviensis CBS 8507]|uniref:hypothetical protein n=1 Tax=Kwoniella mangroviensis CBS 8507 TaxID=1296122 RepID=UPI00080D1253|nr:uncharacterized protein I203_02239 [Kwoniella mangroviensis CBS 8507]OCF68848.1 hypothetical protein I203_02239 [Kwoniella mangroviensis CBS 8507]